MNTQSEGGLGLLFGQVSQGNSKLLDNLKEIWEMQRQVLYSFVPCEDKEDIWVSAPTTGEGKTFRSLSTPEIKAIYQHWLEKHLLKQPQLTFPITQAKQ